MNLQKILESSQVPEGFTTPIPEDLLGWMQAGPQCQEESLNALLQLGENPGSTLAALWEASTHTK